MVVKHDRPEDVEKRTPTTKTRRREALKSIGPNQQWALDGHDKLVKFGLPIYGIRDLFSGKVIALRVVWSNRTEKVVTALFLDTIRAVGGIPQRICTDAGSEIGGLGAVMRTLQYFLTSFPCGHIYIWPHIKNRQHYSDVQYDCHRQMPSPHNITIERFWQFVIKEFAVLVDNTFRPTCNLNLQPDSAIFEAVMMPIYDRELQQSLVSFNNRPIRVQEDKQLPSGCAPDASYMFPFMYGGTDVLIPIPAEAVDVLQQELAYERPMDEYALQTFATLEQMAVSSQDILSLPVNTGWDLYEEVRNTMLHNDAADA